MYMVKNGGVNAGKNPHYVKLYLLDGDKLRGILSPAIVSVK